MTRVQVTVMCEQEATVEIDLPDGVHESGSEQFGPMTEAALSTLEASGGIVWESTYGETNWRPV